MYKFSYRCTRTSLYQSELTRSVILPNNDIQWKFSELNIHFIWGATSYKYHVICLQLYRFNSFRWLAEIKWAVFFRWIFQRLNVFVRKWIYFDGYPLWYFKFSTHKIDLCFILCRTNFPFTWISTFAKLHCSKKNNTNNNIWKVFPIYICIYLTLINRSIGSI